MDMQTGRPATLSPRGMVTSPHSLASAAGTDVLRAGGSAVDAAIATAAVLGVIYPHMTGMGGDAFWCPSSNDLKQNWGLRDRTPLARWADVLLAFSQRP